MSLFSNLKGFKVLAMILLRVLQRWQRLGSAVSLSQRRVEASLTVCLVAAGKNDKCLCVSCQSIISPVAFKTIPNRDKVCCFITQTVSCTAEEIEIGCQFTASSDLDPYAVWFPVFSSLLVHWLLYVAASGFSYSILQFSKSIHAHLAFLLKLSSKVAQLLFGNFYRLRWNFPVMKSVEANTEVSRVTGWWGTARVLACCHRRYSDVNMLKVNAGPLQLLEFLQADSGWSDSEWGNMVTTNQMKFKFDSTAGYSKGTVVMRQLFVQDEYEVELFEFQFL